MRERDREGHELRSLIAGVSEHDSLISRADVLRVGSVDALSDIGALLVEGDQYGARGGVDTELVVCVSDALDSGSHDVLVVELGFSGNFSRDDGHSSRDKRFAGDATLRVLGEARVEDTIRNAVRQFIRMSHSHGFACEITFSHFALQAPCKARRLGDAAGLMSEGLRVEFPQPSNDIPSRSII